MFDKNAASSQEVIPMVSNIVPMPVTIDAETSAAQTAYPYGSISPSETVRLIVSEPEEVESAFQDTSFAILFLINASMMVYLGVTYGTFTIETDMNNWTDVATWKDYVDDDTTTDEEWYQFESFLQMAQEWTSIHANRILVYIIIPAAVIAFFVGFVTTSMVIPSCPTTIVQMTVLGSLGSAIIGSILICSASHSISGSMLASAAMVGMSIWYIKSVWKLIPFASANLTVALKGISSNAGIYGIALFLSLTGILCYAAWSYVLVGVMQALNRNYQEAHPPEWEMSEQEYMEQEQSDPRTGATFLALLLSLYWTLQIINNTVQVTVAGVMATWCFVKTDAESCCSPGVYGSFYRSLTYSFGSICMGSLLQAVVTVLRVLIQSARRNNFNERGGGCVLCVLECIAKCLEDVLDYFNQWSYVYVGIYGYSYLESGKQVIDLFKARGFTAFVTNDLVGYVLRFTNILCGVMTGTLCILIQQQVAKNYGAAYLFGQVPYPGLAAMGVGFLVGICVCSVMMHVVRGAVNTLVVCYADAPAKIKANHPELFQKMSNAWSTAFPEAILNVPSYSVVV